MYSLICWPHDHLATTSQNVILYQLHEPPLGIVIIYKKLYKYKLCFYFDCLFKLILGSTQCGIRKWSKLTFYSPILKPL